MTNHEINEQVARKLGYKKDHQDIEDSDGYDYWDDGKHPHKDELDFTTSISAAWEIVEHLKPTHFIQVWEYPTYCNCRIIREQRVFEAQANTAPLAVCLAFLKLEDK